LTFRSIKDQKDNISNEKEIKHENINIPKNNDCENFTGKEAISLYNNTKEKKKTKNKDILIKGVSKKKIINKDLFNKGLSKYSKD
jgi:hypothetical protein